MTPSPADSIIETRDLTRRYGDMEAVSHLSMKVPRGCVCGFLGPNGAGKTTTIRMLLGLIHPTSGEATVLSRPPGDPAALARIGSLVEAPALYSHLTGRENLEISRLLRRARPERIDVVLELTGLEAAGDKKTGQYSLGMRQRLALALALLDEPDLLILDEPTNGLDPAGIQQMRTFIRELPARTGTTVFLSSHLLAEVEQVASHLVVIHRGTLRFQGSTGELATLSRPRLELRVGETDRAREVLAGAGYALTVSDGHLLVDTTEDRTPSVVALLAGAGVAIFEVSPRRARLEDHFFELTEES